MRGDTHGRETDRVISLYVEEGGYPTKIKDASLSTYTSGKEIPKTDKNGGISFLSIAGKILTKILLNRMDVHLDQKGIIPESHHGFRKDRGTIDNIFTVSQISRLLMLRECCLDIGFRHILMHQRFNFNILK